MGLRDKKHIKVELLLDLFKERGKRVIGIIADIVFLSFNIFIVINGTQLIIELINRNAVSAGMRIPIFLVYLTLPLSSFAMSLRIIGQIIEMIVPQSKTKGGGA